VDGPDTLEGVIAAWLILAVICGCAGWGLARHYMRPPLPWAVGSALLGPLLLIVLAAIGKPREAR
jgi:hypothetical protein